MIRINGRWGDNSWIIEIMYAWQCLMYGIRNEFNVLNVFIFKFDDSWHNRGYHSVSNSLIPMTFLVNPISTVKAAATVAATATNRLTLDKFTEYQNRSRPECRWKYLKWIHCMSVTSLKLMVWGRTSSSARTAAFTPGTKKERSTCVSALLNSSIVANSHERSQGGEKGGRERIPKWINSQIIRKFDHELHYVHICPW